MPILPEDQTLIRRYLLGDVDEATIARVEDRVVDDEAFFDAIELAEDEIIEEYVRGTGSPREREALARFVDTPDRQGRLVLERALARRLGRHVAGSSPLDAAAAVRALERPVEAVSRNRAGGWIGLAAAASVMISAGSAVYLGLETRSLRRELAAMIERQRVEGQPAATAPQQEAQSFLVAPERRLRSGGGSDFLLAIADRSGRVALQFQLTPAASSPAYSVVVRRVGGQQAQIWGETTAPSGARLVVATIPASILAPDDYLATVSKTEGEVIGNYRFRVAP